MEKILKNDRKPSLLSFIFNHNLSKIKIAYFQTQSPSYSFLLTYIFLRRWINRVLLTDTAGRSSPALLQLTSLWLVVVLKSVFLIGPCRRLSSMQRSGLTQGRDKGSHVDTKITSVLASLVPRADNGDDGD